MLEFSYPRLKMSYGFFELTRPSIDEILCVLAGVHPWVLETGTATGFSTVAFLLKIGDKSEEVVGRRVTT
jgi:predicted O-methyltransferase YrrM